MQQDFNHVLSTLVNFHDAEDPSKVLAAVLFSVLFPNICSKFCRDQLVVKGKNKESLTLNLCIRCSAGLNIMIFWYVNQCANLIVILYDTYSNVIRVE